MPKPNSDRDERIKLDVDSPEEAPWARLAIDPRPKTELTDEAVDKLFRVIRGD